MANGKPGRPTVLDGSTREQLLAAISDGMPIKRAAQLVGVHPDTVYATAKRDEGFSDSLKKAVAAFELTHLQKIGRDASWQSSAWLLERIHHKRYAKREAIVREDAVPDKTIKMRPIASGDVRPKEDASPNVDPA